ncbi:MAG: hypothetical protein LBH98_05405 [Chitinispirillales bacterium]|nr:hypothetical protein [Chitinispirillales bacterium]
MNTVEERSPPPPPPDFPLGERLYVICNDKRSGWICSYLIACVRHIFLFVFGYPS